MGDLPRLFAPDDEPVRHADRHGLDGGIVPGVHQEHGRHAVGASPANEIRDEQSLEHGGMHDHVGLLLVEEGAERLRLADARQHATAVQPIRARP